MKQQKYRVILHTEDGTNLDFVYNVCGTNKETAIRNINVCFPCSVKSIERVNTKVDTTDKNMTKYQIEKEKARQEAIEWQRDFDNHNYSYEELHLQQLRFESLARQFGLRKEFRENGII